MNNKTFLIILCSTIVGGFIFYNFYQRRKNNPPIFYRKNLLGNYNAKTIPPFGIYIKESEILNENLLNHEKIHWKQFQNLGLIDFYTSYLKNSYDNNPNEIEARKNESDFCKKNYTFCVRNGLAKTVYNPFFRT